MSSKPTYEELEQRIKELEKDVVKRKKAEEVLQNFMFEGRLLNLLFALEWYQIQYKSFIKKGSNE